MRNVSARLVRIAAIAVALVNPAVSAIADDMPIEGQYLQNRRCKGDRADPAGLKVTITPREITYAGGVCSIDSSRSEGDKFIFAVTCKFRSGAIMGADIAFTPLPGGSLHMVQLDGGFEADLYKCPN